MFAFDVVDRHFSPPSSTAFQHSNQPSRGTLSDKQTEGPSQGKWLAPAPATESPTQARAGHQLQGEGAGIREGGTTDGSIRAAKVLDEFAQLRMPCPRVGASSSSITPRVMAMEQETVRAEQDKKLEQPEVTTTVSHLTGRAARKKKRAMKKAAPAMNTVRGFTPAASADEDSDCSTASGSKRMASRLRDLASSTSSPGLRPSSSGGGISALRLQLDTLNLSQGSGRSSSMANNKSKLGSQTPSSASVTSETVSDGDGVEMTSYEIPLEHDFVSPDVSQKPMFGAIEGGLIRDNAPRKMTASDFEPLSCLGKGTYGTVLLVKQTATGRLYAQKQFRKASLTVHAKLVEQTKTERSILESVNRHPFVVKLYYAFQDHAKLYLILEYASGGELFTHLALERMFSETTAAFYMAEMVLALAHLHQTVGVVYRDLKPENCLLDSEGHLLLTDFGLSKVALDGDDRAHHCNSILGTIEYMAPEVIQGLTYGTAVDWWSLGALGYDLLTGAPPFAANNHAKIQEKILRQKLVLPYFLGPDAKDLLTRLLRKDPAKRLGGCMPRDLKTIKGHRFFRKIDWRALERREVEPPIRPLVTDPEAAENFAAEFTGLALSPVVTTAAAAARVSTGMGTATNTTRDGANPHTTALEDSWNATAAEADPFGGFSFVASRSLLECGDGFF
ncbi:serine/threonine protein kinase psk1 [Acarospora aff. strigata]|nr:serine/threonine protein kinase psk1 [Acarospora aff. strigata]